MTRLGRYGFLAVAVAFHLIYVYSVFDTYFTSPIVHGMRAHEVPLEKAPAQRLVLFVGDGLRADKAFQSFPDPSPKSYNDTDASIPRPLMPFLRSKILHEGTFGVSHTRVPTESRPGHVALIAGLYEDVSAVTTGWKHNPVNFDSVFNRSRHTWSWGSPDILNMFEDGAEPGRVSATTYGAEEEDFSSDAIRLDLWVFDHVKAFFHNARTNDTLAAQLRQDKLVFFLHLLGLDTNGHAKRPYSKEYLHNIQVVDKGVQEIVSLMEDFYKDDGQTAYVFTADHGMSDWGSHGDGNPDNTRTPLIAWGSGVAKPISSQSQNMTGHEDGFSADWGLNDVTRHDVAQADVAALMAYLVGLAFPVNSVGELPLSYLDASPSVKAKALLANARSILEMYEVKEAKKKASSVNYKSFAGFTGPGRTISEQVNAIEKLITAGRHKAAIAECNGLIESGLSGLKYLQTYDWLFLRTLVTTGYIGFIAFGITSIIDSYVLQGSMKLQRTTTSSVAFSSILLVLFSYLYLQQAPWTYYAYAIFPVFFWEETFARRNTFAQSRSILFRHYDITTHRISFSVQALAFIGLLQALVWSYSNRTIYTVCYLIGTFWPICYGLPFFKRQLRLSATWIMACLSMSIFTLLPANKVEDISLVMTGGVLMTSVGILYLAFQTQILGQVVPKTSLSRHIIGVQLGLIPLSMATTYTGASSLQAENGLPLGAQIMGWLVLLASLSIPFLHGLDPIKHYLHRYIILFLAFAPAFVILTISWEGLFYIAFCLTLLTWVRLEHVIYQDATSSTSTVSDSKSASKSESRSVRSQNGKASSTKDKSAAEKASVSTQEYNGHVTKPTNDTRNAASYRALTISDIRPSLFTLYLLQSAFFSTGNIASISSFSLDAVFRLIPVFDPFSQGALLILKILIPFVLLSAALGILNNRLGFAPGALFMGLIVCGDWLTINFFWMVRDEGSWLEIGETISRFCIVSALCVFAAALEGASTWLVGDIKDHTAMTQKSS